MWSFSREVGKFAKSFHQIWDFTVNSVVLVFGVQDVVLQGPGLPGRLNFPLGGADNSL